MQRNVIGVTKRTTNEIFSRKVDFNSHFFRDGRVCIFVNALATRLYSIFPAGERSAFVAQILGFTIKRELVKRAAQEWIVLFCIFKRLDHFLSCLANVRRYQYFESHFGPSTCTSVRRKRCIKSIALSSFPMQYSSLCGTKFSRTVECTEKFERKFFIYSIAIAIHPKIDQRSSCDSIVYVSRKKRGELGKVLSFQLCAFEYSLNLYGQDLRGSRLVDQDLHRKLRPIDDESFVDPR